MANIKISELGAAGALADADLFEIVQGGVNVKLTGAQLKAILVAVPSAVVSDSTTARTASTANANQYTRFTNAAAKTYTFPTGLTVNDEYHGRNMGAGNLTLTPGSGMTLNAPAGGTLVVQNGATFTVKIVATNIADVIGQTVPA